MLKRMTDRMSEDMLGRMRQYADRMSRYMSDRMPDRMSEYMSDRMRERIQDRMSAFM